jgi:hypothetical protein
MVGRVIEGKPAVLLHDFAWSASIIHIERDFPHFELSSTSNASEIHTYLIVT